MEPPIVRPSDPEDVGEAYRALLEVLDGTVFATLDRQQLQATSREFESRAWQVGRGTLRVGFQSLSAFEPQTEAYQRLGAETDLDIHVYGQPDWSPPTIPNVTYHRDTAGTLAPYWFMAFDGGTEESQRCALVAREHDDGYRGFWTYDPSLVGDILDTLEGA
ncbi:DICT sensory domain-containing protein [Halolamina pelagica]|uniref:DICT sensory domain-containing protein n=1 Tax=Halolamina pelagica TaxID=699431 RepID=UPI0006CA91EB|nr:DICT sensory domain-containing protein [Halolamina pelagica]